MTKDIGERSFRRYRNRAFYSVCPQHQCRVTSRLNPSLIKTALRLVLGFAVGVVLLWFALRTVGSEDILKTAGSVEAWWLVGGLTCYALALVLRSWRWHRILSPVLSVSRLRTAEALIVGYAMNYVIPARIGEIVRADYCKRRMGGSRSLALGTIAVERLIDGILVVGILISGLLLLPAHVEYAEVLKGLAITGVLLFGGGAVVLFALSSGWRIRWERFAWLAGLVERRFQDFRKSLRILRSGTLIGQVLLFSIPIWILDSANLWAMVRATGISLSIGQTMLLTGVVSLSTLLPSAPGFLGTIQLAFVISLGAFGFSSASAIVAATANQLLCFGSVVLLGGALMTYFYIGQPIRTPQGDQRGQ
ncbi:MAG: TIGR00374 family protein [Alphaproteobacteria bacterium]|nr:TIGR00374 family protein [Alphaproteobacteria bacterium]